jgi:hypothetical protein
MCRRGHVCGGRISQGEDRSFGFIPQHALPEDGQIDAAFADEARLQLAVEILWALAESAALPPA